MHLLAKLVIGLTDPLVVLGLLVGVGLVLAWAGRRYLARVSLGAAVVVYVVIGLTPLPDWMMRTLEDRFPAAPVDLGAVAGAIVLGGSTGDARVAQERDTYLLSDAAERLTAALGLHREHPSLVIVFSGHHGGVRARGFSEGQMIRRLLSELGLDEADFLFEERSRNTFENARYSYELIEADEDIPWLLVTSAFHMPRSVAVFRSVGFEVVPYPVDYRARPPLATILEPNVSGRFDLFRVALRELLGLAAYRALGRTDTLWPAP